MYDNLPFVTDDIDTIKAFLMSELIVFKNENIHYDIKTGEQLRTTYLKYVNLTLSVRYNREGKPLELKSKGSFHYLMNNGKHNADQKTFMETRDFLINFQNIFNIDLKKLVLAPPEFAVNFTTPYCVEKIIQNTFYEQRKQFYNNAPGNPSKISGKIANDTRLKVYSKYHEHPDYCNPNTLRLEYQAKKMRALHRLGIRTLHDLLFLKNWLKIMELHMSHFKHLVLYDYNIRIPKNSKYKKKAFELSNQNYWENLVKNCKSGKEYNTKYNDEVSILNFLSINYGDNLLFNLLECAESQWVTNLNLCKTQSQFNINRPKHAPVFKQKHAPFIVCMPCKLNNSIFKQLEVGFY